jgi:hypothetical protein
VIGEGGGRVAVGKPGKQRKQRRFDAEHDEQQQPERQAHPVGQVAEALGKLGHVDRAGRRVDQRQRRQKQRRGHQADHDIGHAGADLFPAATERQQHVAGGEHHLEGDKQVEQVTGEERCGDARRQHQIHRVKRTVVAFGARLADRVNQHRDQHHRSDGQHDAGEAVGDQGDAEGRRPAAHLRDDRPGGIRLDQQNAADRRSG